MRAICFSCVVCIVAPAFSEDLAVWAWRKQGEKPKSYPTRTLAQLPGWQKPASVSLDRFGGLKGETFQATGFFYPKKVGDRWWLIDPEGCRFLHVGLAAVTPGSSPRNKQSLPVKFGSREKWRDATVELLTGAGFNGTGAWSDDALLATAKRRLAFTPNLNFMSSYGKKRGGTFQEPGHTGYPEKCIFAFDPEFETFADEHAKSLTKWKDDPYLLGYFSDNEMPFPQDSLDRFLTLDPKDAGYKAAKGFLEKRHKTKAALSADDRESWLEQLADRYFSVVRKAIKRHDPNHLYLGCRFHGGDKSRPGLFRAAGRHVDVISFNLYGVWTPTPDLLGEWTKWSGRPIMITEWYAKGQDSGMPNATGAGWTVATQQDRGRFYQNYTIGLLETKVCVGWHWFKYMDNDPDDLKTDPSNRDSNKGIVTARYEPWPPMIDAMRELNSAVYPLVNYLDRRRN